MIAAEVTKLLGTLCASVIGGLALGRFLIWTNEGPERNSRRDREIRAQVAAYRKEVPGHTARITYTKKRLEVVILKITTDGSELTVGTYTHRGVSWRQAKTMMAVHRYGLGTSFKSAYVNIAERIRASVGVGTNITINFEFV